MEYKFCIYCGSQIPKEALFCDRCGKKQLSSEPDVTTTDHDSKVGKMEDDKSLKDERNTSSNFGNDKVSNNYEKRRSYTSNVAYNESGTPSLINSFDIWVKNWNKYDVCMGRADYWWGYLAIVIISILLSISYFIFNMVFYGSILILLYVFYSVAILAVNIWWIIASIERLHDTGRSGWFFCIAFIPIVGAVILFILCAQPTDWNSDQWPRP